jgi:hypothetical protein
MVKDWLLTAAFSAGSVPAPGIALTFLISVFIEEIGWPEPCSPPCDVMTFGQGAD